MSTKTPTKTPAQAAKPFDAAKYQADKEAKDAKAKSAAASKAPSAAPSVAGGDDSAKAIEALTLKTKAVYDDLRPAQIDNSSADLGDCSNANNIARVANSQLTSSNEKLHPLVSLKNNKALDKFPETSKEIEKLSCMSPATVLQESQVLTRSSDASGCHPQRIGGR